jgi:hypothetical protein
MMKTFARLKLTGPSLDSMILLLMYVVENNPGWLTNEEHNSSYSEAVGEKCFWLIPPEDVVGTPVAIALAGETLKNGRAKMKVTNVVPQERSQLSQHEYNLAVAAANKIVKAALRDFQGGVHVYYDNGEWKLEDVIPAKTARWMFNAYLQGFPRTFHQNDVERLDFFTIALFRNKSKTDPHYIERYLMEDRQWSEEDAGHVRNRITTGLQVLAANRRYSRGV